MKKFLMLAIAVGFASVSVLAQKYALIDSRYIFDKMPEYKQVQKSVESIAAGWQKEIDTKQAALDKLYQEYDAQEAMMAAGAKKNKEAELFAKEKELRDLQKKYFGFEGDLFKKRMELMKPLQEKISKAVMKLSQTNGYDLILDKSEGKSIIFADQKLDKSDEVLKLLQ
jgi:outer membrane protein